MKTSSSFKSFPFFVFDDGDDEDGEGEGEGDIENPDTTTGFFS